MDRIEDSIRSFGGHQYKVCYKDLCCVIGVAKEYQPDHLKMEVIMREASKKTRRCSPKTMWRSVSRAVEDLWESGDKDALTAYQRCWRGYRPKPQEFIEVISRNIWIEEMCDGR